MLSREKTYTLAEFDAYAAQHPDKRLELIDGTIVEKVTSEEHGKIIINIGSELRIVEAYDADGTSELCTDGDTLSGGAVLPGFSLRVRDIFDA